MKRRHPCDVCGRERKRWQRLCAVCWTALPHHRNPIVDAHRRGARAEWRAAVRAAIDHLGQLVQRHMANHARTAAMLGEREA